jgi:hypothetical protein
MVRRTKSSSRTRTQFVRAASELLAQAAEDERDELEESEENVERDFAVVVNSERASLARKLSDRVKVQEAVQNQLNQIQAHPGVKEVKIRGGEKPTIAIVMGAIAFSDHTSDSRFQIGEVRIELYPDGRNLGHLIRNLSERKVSRPMRRMQTPYVGACGKVVNANVMTPLPTLLGRLELYQAFKLILQGATRYNDAHPWNHFLSDWSK